MSETDRILDLLSNFIKKEKDHLFEKNPGDVVEEIMKNVKSYGLAAKFYLRLYWDKIESLLRDSEKIVSTLKDYDEESYRIVLQNREWFNEFITKLYEALKEFVGK